MDVLIVVDMQEIILQGDAKHDLSRVVDRINRLAERVRSQGGRVVFVQHEGATGPGDASAPLTPFTPEWEILSLLKRGPDDRTVRKQLNDAFFQTSLQADLADLGARRVWVAGWATDCCVDATVRSAAALGLEVVVASDCHTVSDRPHMGAERVIEHHQWIWRNLISRHPVSVVASEQI